MTPEEKSSLSAMRKAGRSYTEIAAELGISKNTVKTFCRRNGLTPETESMGIRRRVQRNVNSNFDTKLISCIGHQKPGKAQK